MFEILYLHITCVLRTYFWWNGLVGVTRRELSKYGLRCVIRDTTLGTGLLHRSPELSPLGESYESPSSCCHSSPSPSLRPLSFLNCPYWYFSSLTFFRTIFSPGNFFTTNCFFMPSFSAWKTPVYCLPTNIQGSYWSSIYQILINDQSINIAQVGFGEAA